MKKFLPLILAIFLLSQAVSLAQTQFQCELRLGNFTVNRVANLIWVDVDVANNQIVKDIKFNVETTYNSNTISALPIPARPVKDDGTTDTDKWTSVTPTSVNTAGFHYWMAEDPSKYLPISTNPRKLMEFFVQFSNPIPQYGEVKIRFTGFVVIGVNNSTTITLSTPQESSITINLGTPPDSENDSLKIRSEASTINRTTGEARIKLFYRSPLFGFDHLGLRLYPLDLNIKAIELANPTGRNATFVRTGDYYTISINNTGSYGFAPDVNAYLGEVVLDFAPTAVGTRNIIMNNLEARDLAGQPLKVNGSLSQAIDLGQGPPPPPTNDTTLIQAVSVIDSVGKRVVVILSYKGAGWDTVAFNIYPPSGFSINLIEPPTARIDEGRIKLSSPYPLPKTTDWYPILTVVLGYDNSLSGVQRLILDNFFVKRRDTAVTVANQPLLVLIDLGAKKDTIKPPPPQPIVKYSLALPNDWFYLDRPAGQGAISLLWSMDNIVETTGAINFDVDLPYYMSLQQIIPLNSEGFRDNDKNIDIQKIFDDGLIKTYRVVYSSRDANNPLLPNAQSDNPRNIMRLVIGFVDLPPYTLFIPIKNIIASGLDGRVLNQTKSMSIAIDFLNKIYLPMFRKGDVNKQFGDGLLTQADIDRLIKIINGEIVPSLYERWASDLNNDGKIDSYDLTILQNLIGVTIVKENTVDEQIMVTGRTISFNFASTSQVSVKVYNSLGYQIKQFNCGNTGQIDLSALSSGVYFIKINQRIIKISL